MKVSQFYNKNQFLIEHNGERFLQSYDSIIAKIDNSGELTLYEDWDYSQTTRKHLYLFLYDYCYSIYSLISGSNNKRQKIESLIQEGRIKKAITC